MYNSFFMRHSVCMDDEGRKKKPRDFVTKEFFILLCPFIASYLWMVFYESAFANYFGIPTDLIQVELIDIFAANRLILIAATIGFLWVGLYYNVLPSINSPLFKVMITLILFFAITLGFVFGKSQAESKTDFFVTNLPESNVVLKIYGDVMIVAPFDRQKKTIQKNFQLIKLGTEKDLKLKLESIGPLTILP